MYVWRRAAVQCRQTRRPCLRVLCLFSVLAASKLAVKRTHFPLQASQHPNPLLVRTPFRPAAIIPPAPRPRLMPLPVLKRPPAAEAEDQPIYKIPSAEEIFSNLAPMKTSHLYEVAWSDFVAFLNSPHYSTSVSNEGKGKCFIYIFACLPNWDWSIVEINYLTNVAKSAAQS